MLFPCHRAIVFTLKRAGFAQKTTARDIAKMNKYSAVVAAIDRANVPSVRNMLSL